jgi:hypothetical protein
MSIGAAQHRKRCSRTTAVKITSNSREVHSFGGVSRESSEISGLANNGPLPWQFPTIPMRVSSRKHRVSARGGWPPLLTVPLTDSGRQLKSYWWRKWPPRFGFGPRMFRASLSSALRRPSATSGSIIAALSLTADSGSKGLWWLSRGRSLARLLVIPPRHHPPRDSRRDRLNRLDCHAPYFVCQSA